MFFTERPKDRPNSTAAGDEPRSWLLLTAGAGPGRGLAGVALGSFLATLFAFRVVGGVDQSLLLFPVSGTALGLVLPLWHLGRSKRIYLLMGAAIGFFAGATAVGMPLRLSSPITLFTILDILIGAAILGPGVRTFDDLKQQSNILRLLGAVTIAPLVTGLLGAYPVALFLRQPLFETCLMTVLADSLGMAITTPLVLWLSQASLRPAGIIAWRNGAKPAAFLFFLAVAIAVFWQTSYPLLFSILPPMILFLLVSGLEGAVLTTISLSVIGWIATSHGHGPILLSRADTPLQHLVVLQSFLWVCQASALPIGALLDERKRAENERKEAQSIYQLLLQNANDLIVLSSLDGARRYVSPAVTRMSGWTAEEYLTLGRFDTVHPEDVEAARKLLSTLGAETQAYTLQYRLKQKGGGWRWVEAKVRAYGVAGQSIAGYVSTIRDISLLKETEARWNDERGQMEDLANTDPLTGLLNRRGFDERMLLLNAYPRGKFAMLMLDLDYFKQYNDTYGHQMGDACLVQLAELARKHAVRQGDLTARMGGEEFAVVLLGVDGATAMVLADRLRESFLSLSIAHRTSPFLLATMSIGIALHDGTTEVNPSLMYEQADKALYVSKRRRNCASLYEPEIESMP